MTKKIFSAIVALLLTTPAFSQLTSGGFELDKESVYYGVRIGMTAANLSGDATFGEHGESTDSKVGMTLAGVIGIHLSSTTPVFLESGLYYTERGAKNVGYTNLEIPLLIKYGIKATDDIALLPFVGPYFARACWGETKFTSIDGTKVTQKKGSFDEKGGSVDNGGLGGLKRLNMGFKVGCGAEYNKLYLEVGYQFGVSNIAKDDDRTIHGNAFFANFGVNF